MMPIDPEQQDRKHCSLQILRRLFVFLTTTFIELPGMMHPSYPQGNPTSTRRRMKIARNIYDPTAKAQLEEFKVERTGIYAGLRWRELALNKLLPPDEDKIRADRATQARKMASGASSQQAPPHPTQYTQQTAAQQQAPEDDDESDEDEEDDDDEEGDEEDEQSLSEEVSEYDEDE